MTLRLNVVGDNMINPALIRILKEIEKHVSKLGWDQPARLFAIVDTKELAAKDLEIAKHLDLDLDSFTAVEQENFHGGEDLAVALAQIYWPPEVFGCAIAVERSFLSKEHEADIPNSSLAAEFVAKHPDRQDLRVVVGVLRDKSHYGIARLISNPDDLLSGPDLVPGLVAALSETLSLTNEERNNNDHIC